MSAVAATTRSRGRGRMPQGKRLAVARWLLALFFLAAAVPKLGGAHSQVHMFQQIGAGKWLRYPVGTAELAGAIGLTVTRLAALAAGGLALDMAGASVVNVAILHSPAIALTLPLCVALAALARKLKPTDLTTATTAHSDLMTGATR